MSPTLPKGLSHIDVTPIELCGAGDANTVP
jgi:hypothetical protein